MRRHKSGDMMLFAGALLLALALMLTVWNVREAKAAQECSVKAAENLKHVLEEQEEWSVQAPAAQQPLYLLDPELPMPVRFVDGLGYVGLLEIPALSLELPVLDQCDTNSLKTAPGCYNGTPYSAGLVIGGHNYGSHFGALAHLQQDDEIIFTDVDGNVFAYKVAAQEVLSADAVEEMKDPAWDLTLFTCTLSGRQRVAVRCVRIQQTGMNL